MRYFDLGIIALYLVGITWFGAQFRSSQKSLKDYFLGGKNTPWWAISLSIEVLRHWILHLPFTVPLAPKRLAQK